jgi:hypothetical protein
MAINNIQTSQDLSSAYNPVYIYASATTVNENSFSYIVNVQKDNNGVWEDLYTGSVKPRLGDNRLEMNINKILQSELSGIFNDIELNNNPNIFTNNNSSAYRYRIRMAEQFRKVFDFFAARRNPSNGLLTLYSLIEPTELSAGDSIRITGIAEEYEYNSITQGVNNYAQINFTTSGNNFAVGDTVNIIQNQPFSFPLYNTQTTVLIADPDFIVVNHIWQGASSVPQNGTAIRNRQYDVTHQVTGYTSGAVILPGPIVVPAWVITTTTAVDPNNNIIPYPTGTTGTYVFSDSRLSIGPFTNFGTQKIFNGNIKYDEWIDLNFDNYLAVGIGQWNLLMSDLPDTFCVDINDDIFAVNDSSLSDIGTNRSNRKLNVKTYDINDVLVDDLTIDNPNTITTGEYNTYSQVIGFGPNVINDNLPDIQVLDNCEFTANTGWTISNSGNSNTFINTTATTLTYEDATEFGGSGFSTTIQTNVLTIGEEYTTTLVVENNLNSTIEISDGTTIHYIVPENDTGTFTFTFTATDVDFVIIITGVGNTTHGVEIDSVCTTIPADPIITCDTKKYTIEVLRGNNIAHSPTYEFNVCCKCNQRYTSYTLLFEDEFGALIPFHFDLNHKRSLNIEREHTRKHIGSRQTSGLNPYSYSLAEHSKRTYSVMADEEWELNTDFMSQDMSIFFTQLIMSNNVWIKINGIYYAVNIVDTRHEILRHNNVKNIRYTLRVQFSLRNGKTQ